MNIRTRIGEFAIAAATALPIAIDSHPSFASESAPKNSPRPSLQDNAKENKGAKDPQPTIPKDPAKFTQPPVEQTTTDALKTGRLPPLPKGWKTISLSPEQIARVAEIQKKYQRLKDPFLVKAAELKKQLAERSQELDSKIKAIRQEPSVKMDAIRQEVKRIQASIQDATASQQKEMLELQRQNQRDNDETQRKIRGLKQDLERQMEALLTPEQRERLAELKVVHIPVTKKP